MEWALLALHLTVGRDIGLIENDVRYLSFNLGSGIMCRAIALATNPTDNGV